MYSVTTGFLFLVKNTIGGFVSGVIATPIVQPLDVMRTRLVGQGEPKVCLKNCILETWESVWKWMHIHVTVFV